MAFSLSFLITRVLVDAVTALLTPKQDAHTQARYSKRRNRRDWFILIARHPTSTVQPPPALADTPLCTTPDLIVTTQPCHPFACNPPSTPVHERTPSTCTPIKKTSHCQKNHHCTALGEPNAPNQLLDRSRTHLPRTSRPSDHAARFLCPRAVASQDSHKIKNAYFRHLSSSPQRSRVGARFHFRNKRTHPTHSRHHGRGSSRDTHHRHPEASS